MVEKRFDAHHQISEMEDKVYVKFENAKETRRASHQETAYIIAEEKYKVAEVQRLASNNMAKKMEETEENSEEVR